MNSMNPTDSTNMELIKEITDNMNFSFVLICIVVIILLFLRWFDFKEKIED